MDTQKKLQNVLSMAEEAEIDRQRNEEHQKQEALADKIATKLAGIMGKKGK